MCSPGFAWEWSAVFTTSSALRSWPCGKPVWKIGANAIFDGRKAARLIPCRGIDPQSRPKINPKNSTVNEEKMAATAETPATAPPKTPFSRIYLGFLASAAGILLLLLVLGFEPTRRLGGQLAIPAMLVGCLISLLAALVGTLPIFLALGRKAADTVPALLASMVARMLTALMLLLIAGTNPKFEPAMNTLVVWLILSHTALLVAEIRFARRALYVG